MNYYNFEKKSKNVHPSEQMYSKMSIQEKISENLVTQIKLQKNEVFQTFYFRGIAGSYSYNVDEQSYL